MLHGENHTYKYHPFTYSASHKDRGWNQKSQFGLKGQISTSLISIACVSWHKQVSSYIGVLIQKFNHEDLV